MKRINDYLLLAFGVLMSLALLWMAPYLFIVEIAILAYKFKFGKLKMPQL